MEAMHVKATPLCVSGCDDGCLYWLIRSLNSIMFLISLKMSLKCQDWTLKHIQLLVTYLVPACEWFVCIYKDQLLDIFQDICKIMKKEANKCRVSAQLHLTHHHYALWRHLQELSAQRWCWSWTRWLCVGDRRAESERGGERTLKFTQTHHQKSQERAATLACDSPGVKTLISVRCNGTSGPVKQRRQASPSPSQPFTTGLCIPQISSANKEPGEEAAPWTKDAYKKCHCCVLEVRRKTTLWYGTTFGWELFKWQQWGYYLCIFCGCVGDIKPDIGCWNEEGTQLNLTLKWRQIFPHHLYRFCIFPVSFVLTVIHV